jgi:hypothetical protein
MNQMRDRRRRLKECGRSKTVETGVPAEPGQLNLEVVEGKEVIYSCLEDSIISNILPTAFLRSRDIFVSSRLALL